MLAHAATNLRLIRTFYHFSFLTLYITASSMNFSNSAENAGLDICTVCFWFAKTGRTLYRNDSDTVNLDSMLTATDYTDFTGQKDKNPSESVKHLYCSAVRCKCPRTKDHFLSGCYSC